MDNDKYFTLFKELGIRVNPLPENYNPDSYGKKLMQNFNFGNGVLYADSTKVDQSFQQRVLAK